MPGRARGRLPGAHGEKYQRRVYWIAYNMLSNYDTAREIAQEAFIRVFRNISRFDVKKNFYTWLYQITVNLCIDRMRKLSHGKTVDLSLIHISEPTRLLSISYAVF